MSVEDRARALALYHWLGDFVEAITAQREVWLLATRQRCRSTNLFV